MENNLTSVNGKIKEFIINNEKNINVVLEIGSHFGTDTIELKKILPKSTIFCFEPDPRNIKITKEIWGDETVGELFEVAVSNFNGKTKLNLSSGDCSFWTDNKLISKNDWSASNSIKKPIKHLEHHPWVKFNEEIEVDCIKLDDFNPLSGKIIDFIWMDVQGAEDLVIEGSRELLKRTKFLYTEYNNEELYENQLDINGILNLLGEDWQLIEIFDNDILLKNKNMNIIKINDVAYDMSSPSGLEFKNKYITSFGDEPLPKVTIKWSHIEGFYLNLNSDSDKEFIVKIFDKDNSLLYQTTLKNNMYSKLNRKYYNGIRYEIYYNSNLILQETINFKNKQVYIAFDSSSLGDTISWVPYCEEFRKINECELIVSTFKNDLFEKSYPNIKFVQPGGVVHNIYAMFNIGWFYDNDKEPEYPSTIPLQKSITNILGLDFKEIQSNVYFEPKNRPYNEKYICIATNSTAACKLWNNPIGWVELVKYLNSLGYKVINISKDGDKVDGVIKLKDDSMINTMNVIHHSEFVIGLSSGLSWLSWGLGKHVVMISNFTEENHEFTTNCTRITNSKVCNGCWNNPMFKFDKGDWNWCPEHKGTERQFECHKSITPEMVINKIQHLIN
jgi:autotransporter strand-loop-strand O-heptosyltransferase